MSRLDGLPILPVQSIGSAAAPPWVWLLRDAVAEDRLGPADITESLRDAARVALLDQEEAGYDVVSDGEMLRADFTRNFHGHIEGLEAIEYERRLGHPGPDQLDAFRAVEPISAPRGYGLVAEVEYLSTLTERPFVTALQGPVTQAFRIDPGEVYAHKGEVAWALVPDINRELKSAVDAGAHFIQLDEPAFWILPGGLPEMVEIANACIEGVAGHDLAAPLLRQLPRSAGHGPPLVRRLRGALRGPRLRRPQPRVRQPLDVAGRPVGRARRRQDARGRRHRRQGTRCRDARTSSSSASGRCCSTSAPEKLWLSADCGYSQTARPLAVEKMRALVEAVRTVRAELAG